MLQAQFVMDWRADKKGEGLIFSQAFFWIERESEKIGFRRRL